MKAFLVYVWGRNLKNCCMFSIKFETAQLVSRGFILGLASLRVNPGEAILQHLCALNSLPAAWDGHHAVVPACSMQGWFSTNGRVGGRFVFLDINCSLVMELSIFGRIDKFENTVYPTVLFRAVHATILGWNDKYFSQWRRVSCSGRSGKVPCSSLGYLCYPAWYFSSLSINSVDGCWVITIKRVLFPYNSSFITSAVDTTFNVTHNFCTRVSFKLLKGIFICLILMGYDYWVLDFVDRPVF